MIRMYRYSEDELSFIMIDGRDVEIPRFRKRNDAHAMCLLHGTDGIVILDKSEKADFLIEFVGADGVAADAPDGARRCAVAFADLVGVKPFHTKEYSFEASGSTHDALILSHLGECKVVKIGDCEGSALCEGELE